MNKKKIRDLRKKRIVRQGKIAKERYAQKKSEEEGGG